ncbi:ribonuclease [Sphingomonas sp. GCM10030256]|uniref:ribonuclease n=1 Tax=Sphingomonas sp. GCM10030256 TaxID=3273427 RepID=UPI00361BFC40
MPEWWVERGIGETRAALVEGGRIVESLVELDGGFRAGERVAARLGSIGQNGRNAIARTTEGREILLPSRPTGVSEGSALTVEITREAIPGHEPWKRPIGRTVDGSASSVPPLEARLGGRLLPFPPSPGDPLGEAGWSDLLAEAASGLVDFAGGRLRLFLTPAMTLIDVDGVLPPDELASAGAAAAGQAIRRLGIAGSIGIDLPTTRGKAARAAAAEELDRALRGTQFERTGVNGFGFVHLIRPRRRPSLLELYGEPVAAEARALLRRAGTAGFGPARLAAHPRVVALLGENLGWLEQLAVQRGGAVTLRPDEMLAISAGHVEPA